MESEMQNSYMHLDRADCALTGLEIVALDLFFAGHGYVTELAALGAGAVTMTVSGAEQQVFDVSGLAGVVSQDWVQFESQIQTHFGFDPNLNDVLILNGIQAVIVGGFDFHVGGWF
jgi:hypothetical protein